MNNLFKKIATSIVGIAMAVGMGVAFGRGSNVSSANASASTFAEAPDVSMDDDLGNATTNTGLPSSGTSGWVSSIASNAYDTSYGRGYAFGNGADPVITFYSSGKTWAKVIVIASANSTNSSLSVSVGGTAYTPDSLSVANGTANKNQEYVFEGNSSGNVTVTVTNTNSSKSTWILDIGLYEASGGQQQAAALSEIISLEGTLTAEQGTAIWNLSSLTPMGRTDDMESTDDPVDISSYVELSTTAVPGDDIVENGNVEVTVTPKDSNSTVQAAVFNVVANVTAASKGSRLNPYTVAEAVAEITAHGTINSGHITGKIVKVDSTQSDITQYKNATYWISDDGTENGPQFQIFRGKGLNNADFTSLDELGIWATVVVVGKLLYYNNQKYEADSGNYLVSYAPFTDPFVSLSDSAAYLCKDVEGNYFEVEASTQNIENPTFVWTTADENISLQNADTDKVKIKLNSDLTGTAEVKLAVNGDNLTEDIEKTVSVKILAAMSVAEVNTALATNELENVFVKGFVSKIESTALESNKGISYWINDNLTTTGQIEVFKGKGLYNADFKALTDVALKDEVVVFGSLYVYKDNNNETNEFRNGNYLVSQIKPFVTSIEAEYANIDIYDGQKLLPANITITGTKNTGEEATIEASAATYYVGNDQIDLNEYTLQHNQDGSPIVVTVKYNNLSANFSVSPIAVEPKTMVITPASVSVEAGHAINSQELTITITNNDGSDYDYELTDLSFFLDDNLTNSVPMTTQFTEQMVGQHTITAVLNGHDDVKATFSVEVVSALVHAEDVELDHDELALVVDGQSATLVASVTPQACTDTPSWKTSDAAVATVTVDPTSALSATVAPVASGTAVITVTVGEQSATCNVTVALPDVESVTVSSDKVLNLKVDETSTIEYSVLPAKADQQVTWASSNETVATVAAGVVTAKAVGTATITVASKLFPTIKDEVTVNVAAAPQEAVATMALGTSNSTAAVVKVGTTDNDAVKLGKSGEGGNMTIKVGKDADSLSFYAAAWNKVNNATITFSGASVTPTSVELTSDSGISNNSPFTLAGTDVEAYKFTVALSGVVAETTITLTSNDRCVVWGPTYTVGAPAQAIAPTSIALDRTEANLEVGDTLTLTPSFAPDGASADVTWTSSDAAVATVKDGVVTAVGAGNATISATVDQLDPATCAITVAAAGSIKGHSADNPFTPAEANEECAKFMGTNSADDYYVAGKVSKIEELNTQHGNATFFISADGEETGDQFYVYRAKNLEGANFTSADQLVVGDEVIVVGKLVTHVHSDQSTTPELATGGRLYSVTHSQTPVDPGTTPTTVNYGSATAPLTIAEANTMLTGLNLASGSFTAEKVYVKGVVKSHNAYSEQYGSYSKDFYIQDGDNEFLSYHMYIADGVLTLTDELKAANGLVGYEVVLCGYVKNYNGKLEMAQFGTGDDAVNPTIIAATAPGTTDPGTTDPGTTDPGTTNPGTEPGTETPAAKTVTGIQVSGFDKVNYQVGQELDLSELKVLIMYSDGTFDVATADQIKVEGYDPNKAGQQTVTVSVGDQSWTVKVMVTDAMGCHGSVVAGSALISLTTLLGAGLLVFKKRKED